ncbi:MAG TPA: peptide ABC transporter substrate-binding protein [Thermomicrobiales bacterium]|jgi:peptide/nickel transport system substrate-binding protein|nr:peptide ABC transporter substrate-binding protein [Thermomicrobiales bacterium]
MAHDPQSAHADTMSSLVADLAAGRITRRDFIARGVALGTSLALLGMFVRSVQTSGAAPHPQDAAAAPPAVGMDGKTRGQDGELKILMWQAVTMMSPHVASGTKDYLAGSLVVEPLMHYLPDSSLWSDMLTEVPTQTNGGLNEDLTEVTLKIREGLVWSDGTPFTANDVVFTHQWVTDPANNTTNIDVWGRITAIEAVDDLTVRATYGQTDLAWFEPFTSYTTGPIYPRHYVEANGGDIMLTAPLGTGPYKVESFAPNDQVIYVANENYRDPNKPAFARVNMKGGGDPASVAQSVLQTGDWDYAWNVTIEPDVVAPMMEQGIGRFLSAPATSLERININFSDPDTEGPDGQRSYWEIPNPVLSDPAVRQAMALGIDRELILNRFYAPPGDRNTSNFLNGIPVLDSPNTSWSYDSDAAAQLLEDAGWTMQGDVREKDGVRLELSYSTSIASVRQKTQQVVKQNLEAIGFRINLQQVDSAIFFDSSVGNDQNLRHMYSDINVYTNGAGSPSPIDYMNLFYSGENGANIAQASNGWSGTNVYRYQNAEYDMLYESLLSGEVTDMETLYGILIQLNDIVMADNAVIPLINVGNKYCMHGSMIHGDIESGEDNSGAGGLDGVFWNIVNWNRATPVDR